ncbi:MAG: hypothetical protein PVG03_06010 [Desulfarculaceae bacterium]|jgi:hypothetical protein
MADPTGEDIHALSQGDASFALLVRENIIFLLAKMGRRSWTVSHYNWWINPPFLRPDPLVHLQAEDTGIALQTCLADACTGMVAATRTFGLSSDFGRVLLKTVAKQMLQGLDPWHQLEVATELLERSPDLSLLLKEAVCLQFCQMEEGQPDLDTEEMGLACLPGRSLALMQ